MKFINKIMRFMYGRYKNDQLNYALLVFAAVFMVISRIMTTWWYLIVFLILSWVFYLLALICLGLFVFRFLSKNIYKRSYENRIFLKIWNPVKEFFKLQWRKIKDFKTHRYLKCPRCKARLRVKKRKGKHSVRCPKCGAEFEKNFFI